jgi:diaminopimelate epimerase
MSRPFLKMNGLGNDFVVVEARSAPFHPGIEQARAIADRKTGVGCDQVLAIEPSANADVFMRIWNADGDEVGACGNGARCVGWLLLEASGRDKATIETGSGILSVTRAGPRLITVDMGEPRLDWTDIPLAEDMDTRGIELQVGPIDEPILHTPSCVSMGNPHVIFFVPQVLAAPVLEVGPMLEHHHLFPERANICFAQIKGRDRLRLRVWERGVGETLASGTGACAAVVAASRLDLSDRAATVEMNGGELTIEWREADNHVIMTGPITLEYTGNLS